MDATVSQLLARLSDADAGVRAGAVSKLTALGPSVLEHIVPLLHGPDLTVRWEALRVIGGLGRAGRSAARPVARCRHDRDPVVRQAAADAYHQITTRLGRVRRRVVNWKVGCALGLLALGSAFAVERTRDAIIGWVRGEPFYNGRPARSWVRTEDQFEQTVEAFKAGGPDALAVVLHVIDRHDRPADGGIGRAVWVRILGDLGPRAPERVLPALLDILRNPEHSSRESEKAEALYALTALGPAAKMAFPEILPYFDHPNLHWPAALALEASDPQESRRHVITCAFKKPGDETPTLLPNDRRWAQFSADGREFGIAGLGWAMAWPLSGGEGRLLTPERQPINGATFLPNGGQMLITYPTGVEEHWRVVHLLSGDTAVQLPPLIRQSHWDPLIKKDVSLQEFSKTVLANLKLWRDLTISADQSTIFCATGGDLDAFRRTSKGGYERVGVTFRGSPAREEEVCFASALAPDGSVFVTASTGSIRVWDLAADRSGAKLRWQKSWDGVTNRLLVTPDGCILAARSIPGDVRVLHPLTGDLIRGLPVESTDAQLTPDGKQLVVARPGGLDVWDWRTGQRVAKHDYGNGIARRDPLRLVVSSDGLRVAVVFPDIIRFHNLPALLAKQE